MSADRPLRLAVVCYYLPSESKIGAGWATHRLANALVGLGHDVTMFSPCRRPDDARYHHEQVVIEGRYRTVRWPFLLRQCDFSRFDGLLAAGDDHLIPRRAVPAHVRTMHGTCFDEAIHVTGTKEKVRMFGLGLTELMSAVRVREVVGVSHASLRFFPWRHAVIPNGVDTEVFRPGAPDDKAPDPTILFVGTYKRRKRGKLLMELFADVVRPQVPDARLWMVCDDAPAAPGVEVLGRVSDERLAELYRQAWAFCLPSSYEGFGVPYAEALVSGLPVVASPNRGALEVLEHGACGILADDEHLGAELVRVLTDPALRERLRSLGIERRERYSLRTVAQQYVDLVRAQLA